MKEIIQCFMIEFLTKDDTSSEKNVKEVGMGKI